MVPRDTEVSTCGVVRQVGDLRQLIHCHQLIHQCHKKLLRLGALYTSTALCFGKTLSPRERERAVVLVILVSVDSYSSKEHSLRFARQPPWTHQLAVCFPPQHSKEHQRVLVGVIVGKRRQHLMISPLG